MNMNARRSTLTQLATAALVIVSVGAVSVGVLLGGVALVGGELIGGPLGGTATIGAGVIAVLAIVFAVGAGIAGWALWAGRGWGRVLAMVVGGIAILGPVSAALSSGWHAALWVSMGLGAAILGAVLLDRQAP